MATGNVKDPKRLSKNELLSKADKSLQKASEENLKKQAKLAKQLGLKNIEDWDKESQKTVKKITNEFRVKMKEAVNESLVTSVEALGKLYSSTKSGVDEFIGSYQKYYSNINTRLAGTDKSYNDILETLKGAVSGSRSTSVVAVLDKLNNLLNKGIAYNVEQRAFLDTLSDKIATTFDAANGTLLQLIRLNRSDSTAAYLGMEAALTEYLNATYSDTSYLTQNINEQVSAAIYEATSQLGAEQGAAFEYVVQKWLGSFYETGVNANTIQTIAQGLGYLGSGNVASLTSNSQLSNLFIAAAQNAGLDYSRLLTDGLSSESANRLLQGIYQQSQVIASSGDQVAKSQFAAMFGMTIADLSALMQLTSSDLESISSNMYTYSNMIARTEQELRNIASRTSVQEAVENTIKNVMAEIGDGIASSAVQLTTYELAKLIEGNVSIPIPWVGPIDLGATMQGALLGYNVIASLGGIMTALTGNKTLSLASFTGLDTYGGGLVSSVGANTIDRTSGMATYIGTSESTATASGSVSEMKTQGAEVLSSAEEEESKTIDDLWELTSQLKDVLTGIAVGGSVVTVRYDESLA